eukprot:scaffold1983_cov376-Prasinococcus_capsulatus_cf.AAC.13
MERSPITTRSACSPRTCVQSQTTATAAAARYEAINGNIRSYSISLSVIFCSSFIHFLTVLSYFASNVSFANKCKALIRLWTKGERSVSDGSASSTAMNPGQSSKF